MTSGRDARAGEEEGSEQQKPHLPQSRLELFKKHHTYCHSCSRGGREGEMGLGQWVGRREQVKKDQAKTQASAPG